MLLIIHDQGLFKKNSGQQQQGHVVFEWNVFGWKIYG